MVVDVVLVAGARPNFMKVSPICEELQKKGIEHLLVHTGQHYDENMSGIFFRELGISQPDVNLGVGSSSHATQTAKIMIAFEEVCIRHTPKVVLVVGDVNSTIACALVAKKMGISVGHVEAGLRSFDRNMPEEINRILTDSISDFLYTTSLGANLNLIDEGVNELKIHFVGNVMVDTLLKNLTAIKSRKKAHSLGLENRKFGLVTIHRPSNVDDINSMKGLLDAISLLSNKLRLVFPMHPRTRKTLQNYFPDWIAENQRVEVIEPLGYLDFVSLVYDSNFVITDSGGIQEETSILGIPCFTIRENTERPITTELGTNRLITPDFQSLSSAIPEILSAEKSNPAKIPLWDGLSSSRIVEHLDSVISSS